MAAELVAPYVLEYTYRRSTGPVLGRFLAGLKEKRICGVKTRGGKVLVPPAEYDPDTGEALTEFIEVGEVGVVTSWAWASQPKPRQPLGHPFAWALVKLDGADTAMLHAVDAKSAREMATGVRVRVRWKEQRAGEMQDIACFELESAG